MSDDLRSLGKQIAAKLAASTQAMAKPGPVKAQRELDNEPALARYKAAVDRLGEFGWSWERIAKYLGCSKQNVMGVYEGHPYVPARYLDKFDLLPELQALPARMRAEQLQKAG